MVELIQYLFAAVRAYKLAKSSGGTSYVGITRAGVPTICVFVGLGREAWRVSQRAIEEAQRWR